MRVGGLLESSFLLLRLGCLAGLKTVVGALQCACSTSTCKEEGKTTCMSSQWCYVQRFDSTNTNCRDHPPLVQGCIDDVKKPLLCENRRPSGLQDPCWPTLLCCKDDLCNKDIVPTLRWTEQYGGLKTTSASIRNVDSHMKEGDYVYSGNQRLNTEQGALYRTNSFNPIFVGIPVAGACVLLALVIFAIFLLKRRRGHLVDAPYEEQKGRLRPSPPVQCHVVQNGRIPSFVQSPTKVQKSERCSDGSSGSESRLLTQV